MLGRTAKFSWRIFELFSNFSYGNDEAVRIDLKQFAYRPGWSGDDTTIGTVYAERLDDPRTFVHIMQRMLYILTDWDVSARMNPARDDINMAVDDNHGMFLM